VNTARALLGLLLGRRLPRLGGRLQVAGPRQAITISRDRWGIPHIEAANDHDAWFGLGFCNGQDRAFQLESILRVSRGTLAELIGKRGLAVDRLSRRIGFRRAALAHWPALPDEAREILTAFAAGINAGAAAGPRPHELVILRGSRTPWDGPDVLAYVKLQSFLLPSNWDAELARLQVVMQDGPEALKALDPAVRGLAAEVDAFRALLPPGGGSNNWAIHASRTSTGRPIVCNDPHLFPTLPSQWYLAHVQTPEWALAGGSFAGSPGFAAGFNGHVAWGTTAALIDNADLFIEQLSADGCRVRQGEGWVECKVHRETIHVRRGRSIVEDVLETPRGPIISPALSGSWPALSLRAVWLDALPIRGYMAVARARNVAEFRECFRDWPCLPVNIVLGDTAGTIAFQMAGDVPRRALGPAPLPRAGWDEANAWGTRIPFEEMPHVLQPAAGFYCTANNAPPGHEQRSPLGIEWMDTYRRDAIVETLEAKKSWSVADCLALQLDQRSLPWREVRDIVLDAASRRESLRPVWEMLRSWNGVLAAGSSAAAIFEVFAAELMVQLARAKAPASHVWMLGETAWSPGVNMFYLKRMGPLSQVLRNQPAGWFDRPWSEVIADALEIASRRCAGKSWGELHPLRPRSPLLGDTWLLRRVFSTGPIPFGGDTDTINQGSVHPMRPIDETDNIAGLRMAVDVGNWSASRFVICGGQSGNPLSAHYDDMFALWQRGEGVPMAWTSEEIRAAARWTLTIEPA
jgi:penicillin amidase